MLKMFRNTIYIRLRAEKISILHLESGKEVNLIPQVAIESLANGRKKILAVGNDAQDAKSSKSNVEIVNGFKHPRTLIADFTVAEETLKYCLRLITPKGLFVASPVIIFQPLEMAEGGYTQVEMRAFEELCKQTGARTVLIKLGAEFTTDELAIIKIKGV